MLNLKAITMVMELSVERRGRGRPKRWLNTIECDMRTAGVCENDVKMGSSGGGRLQIAGKVARKKK